MEAPVIERVFQGELAETVRNLVRWLLGAGEMVLLGLALLVVAIAVAKTAEVVLRGVLRRVGLDTWSDRFGLGDVLRRFGVGSSVTHVIARVTFYVAALFVAQIVADALGLAAVATLIASVVAYAPRVVAAGLILVVGTAAAGHARRAVMEAAGDSGIEYASALGGVVFAVILFALGLMAISQLQITTDAVWLVLGWLLGGLALALGLSFGLGARDVTRNILAGFYSRRIFRIGQEVELQGQRGVLVSITPTHALIDEADAIVSVANSRLLDEVVRQPK